ncbi:MAG: isoprenylcysteine carboxyl methyltransferase family protein [Candidatus Kryptoniota bacterium]
MNEVLGWIFLLFVLAQRFVELLIAKRHEQKMKSAGAKEIDKNGYRLIVVMHIAFFVSLACEKIILNKGLSSRWILLASIFVVAQFLRYWAIASLGMYWNTKILIVPNHPLIRKGPYKFFHHPNYIAVEMELLVIPLIFSCYVTSFVFTVLNAVAIRRRIRVETRALRGGLA